MKNLTNKVIRIVIIALITLTTIEIAQISLMAADIGSIEMYRKYNPNSGEHFYTSQVNEKNNLVSLGWNYEGIGWYAPSTGDPVYRLYNSFVA